VYRRRDVPVKVSKLDVTTGKRELWKELAPRDGAGIQDVAPVIPTPTARRMYMGIRGLSRTCTWPRA
jgi:hypothetical protein